MVVGRICPDPELNALARPICNLKLLHYIYLMAMIDVEEEAKGLYDQLIQCPRGHRIFKRPFATHLSKNNAVPPFFLDRCKIFDGRELLAKCVRILAFRWVAFLAAAVFVSSCPGATGLLMACDSFTMSLLFESVFQLLRFRVLETTSFLFGYP